MADWGLAFLKIERCLPSLFCKSKMNIPFMLKALGKDVIKSEKSAPFLCGKTRLRLKKVAWGKPFDVLYIGRNPSANAR